MTGSSLKKKRIIAAGSPIIDLLLQLSEEELAAVDAVKGSMNMSNSAEQNAILERIGRTPVMTPGGSAGNTAFTLARLGVPTAFFGKVGLDMYGQYYVQEFCRLGGELEFFRYTDNLATARCLSLVTPDAERTMLPSLDAAADLGDETITPDALKGFDALYCEGYMIAFPFMKRLFAAARNAGCEIMLDLSDFRLVDANREKFAELLADGVDIIFANEREAEAFCGGGSTQEQLEKLSALCRIAVIKLGADGCMVRDADGTITHIRGLGVEAVDTTAAGDVFQAGFIYGYLTGRPMPECGRMGNVLGSEVVQVMGTVIPEERWLKAVAKFIKHEEHDHGL